MVVIWVSTSYIPALSNKSLKLSAVNLNEPHSLWVYLDNVLNCFTASNCSTVAIRLSTHTPGLVVTFILLHSSVKSLHGALVSMASCYKACCIMASPSNKACHLVALMCMYLESSSLPALTFSPCG